VGKVLVILASFALACIAGPMMLGGYEELWAPRATRSECKVIQARLASLKGLLVTYKARHGRYPTTEEGLGALDTFAARFPYPLGAPWEKGDSISRSFRDVLAPRMVHPEDRRAVVDWLSRKRGRLPQDANEFNDALGGPLPEFWFSGPYDRIEAEIAIAADGTVFPITAAGVLSPWLVPYVYENRRGVPPAAFDGSPVDGDWWGRYSLKVDDGVYVACVGGQARTQELNSSRLIGSAFLAAGLALLALAGWGLRGGFHSRLGTGVALVLAAAGGVGVTTIGTLCYAVMGMFEGHSTDIAARRVELLEKHRAGGAISDAAYQKALAAMRLMDPHLAPKPTAPATRPGGEGEVD
jgi:hypothetical protein